jgi:hypothetical protein
MVEHGELGPRDPGQSMVCLRARSLVVGKLSGV